MTAPDYRARLADLRTQFPSPRPDSQLDRDFLQRWADALERALALRTAGPRLNGSPLAAADPTDPAILHEASDSPDAVVDRLIDALRGLPLEVHPRGQVNVNVQPSTLGLIGGLLPAIFNPNMSSDGRGAGCSAVERRMVAMTAELVGLDPDQAGGVFTFGGTGTLLYGVKLGLEKACPDAMRRGLSGGVTVLASRRCHHTCLTSAGWLGVGSDQVRRIDVGPDHAIDVAKLRAAAEEELRAGRRIAAIVATVGTTDAFGLDDVAAIADLRDELVDRYRLDYHPHLHADAVIGWAWAAFHGYAAAANPLGFSPPTVAAIVESRARIAGLARADSIGVDFHKTGFAPYVSSLVLVRRRDEFERLARRRDQMPYLFHSGAYHPGMFTLETTRAAGGVLAAWANLLWLGRDGLRTLLGHALEMTARLRTGLQTVPGLALVNRLNAGPVTLYRAYPAGVDPESTWRREQGDPGASDLVRAGNEYNRRLHALVNETTDDPAAVGLTTAAAEAADGTPLIALKSYLLSPWLEPSDVDAVVAELRSCSLALQRSTP